MPSPVVRTHIAVSRTSTARRFYAVTLVRVSYNRSDRNFCLQGVAFIARPLDTFSNKRRSPFDDDLMAIARRHSAMSASEFWAYFCYPDTLFYFDPRLETQWLRREPHDLRLLSVAGRWDGSRIWPVVPSVVVIGKLHAKLARKPPLASRKILTDHSRNGN